MNLNTKSRRWQAGTRRNKRLKHVGTQPSDVRRSTPNPPISTVVRLPGDAPKVARFSLGMVQDMSLATLREWAREWAIVGRSKMKRLDLEEAVYRHENNSV